MQAEGFHLLHSTKIKKTNAMNHPQILMKGGSCQYTHNQDENMLRLITIMHFVWYLYFVLKSSIADPSLPL